MVDAVVHRKFILFVPWRDNSDEGGMQLRPIILRCLSRLSYCTYWDLISAHLKGVSLLSH